MGRRPRTRADNLTQARLLNPAEVSSDTREKFSRRIDLNQRLALPGLTNPGIAPPVTYDEVNRVLQQVDVKVSPSWSYMSVPQRLEELGSAILRADRMHQAQEMTRALGRTVGPQAIANKTGSHLSDNQLYDRAKKEIVMAPEKIEAIATWARAPYRTGSGLRKPPPLVYRTPRRKADPHVHIPSHTAITKEEWKLIKIRGAVVTGDAPGGLPF